MSPTASRAFFLPLAVLSVVGCGDPYVDDSSRGGLFESDAGAGPPPDEPQLQTQSAVQPYSVFTLNGKAFGRRIYVEGAGNRHTYGVLSDGSFCADVPLPAPGAYELYVRVQATDGQVSEPAGPVRVVWDENAVPPAGAVTCSGSDPQGCAGSFEICNNGRDDDCNNLIDDQDPRCAVCQDDDLEENDSSSSPRIPVNRSYDLQLCAGDEDWFAVYLEAGETVDASIRFTHSEGDLNLELYDDDGQTVLGRSSSLTDVETVSHTATTASDVQVRVFGSPITSNPYRLELGTRGP